MKSFSKLEKDIIAIMVRTLKVPEDFSAIYLFKKMQRDLLGIILSGDTTPEEIGIVASFFE